MSGQLISKSVASCSLDDSYDDFKVQPRKLRKTQSSQNIEICKSQHSQAKEEEVVLKAEVELATSNSFCPICDNKVDDLANHIRSCCTDKFRFSRNNISEKEVICGIQYDSKHTKKKEIQREICSVCEKDISHMNKQRRLQHVNRCADNTSSNHSAIDASFPCPFCGINSSTAENRTLHLKRCGKKLNLKPEALIQAAQLQEKHEAERKAIGLPILVKAKPKATYSKKTKVFTINSPKNVEEDQLQIAMALSASLLEDKNTESPLPEISPLDIENQAAELKRFSSLFSKESFPPPKLKGARRKKQEKIYKLALQNDEDRMRQIQWKVSELLECQSNLCSNEDINWKCINSRDCPLWDLTSLKGTLSREDFYVQNLLGSIQPCKSTVGWRAKHFHLSQIAGRQSVGSNKEVNFQLDETIPPIISTPPLTQLNQHEEDSCFGGFFTQTTKYKAQSAATVKSKVSSDFSKIVGKDDFSDASVSTNDGEIPVHLVIFFSRCPKLLNEFKDTKVLNLEEYDHSTVLNFIEFIYTGECLFINEMQESKIKMLKDLAERYDVHDLMDLIDAEQLGNDSEEFDKKENYQLANETLHNLIHSVWLEPDKLGNYSDVSMNMDNHNRYSTEENSLTDDGLDFNIMLSLSRFISQDNEKEQLTEESNNAKIGVGEVNSESMDSQVKSANNADSMINDSNKLAIFNDVQNDKASVETDVSVKEKSSNSEKDSYMMQGDSTLFMQHNFCTETSSSQAISIHSSLSSQESANDKKVGHSVNLDPISLPSPSPDLSLILNDMNEKTVKILSGYSTKGPDENPNEKCDDNVTKTSVSLREKIKNVQYIVLNDIADDVDMPDCFEQIVKKSPRTPIKKQSPNKCTTPFSSPTSSVWLSKSVHSSPAKSFTNLSKEDMLSKKVEIISLDSQLPILLDEEKVNKNILPNLSSENTSSQRMSSPDIFADDESEDEGNTYLSDNPFQSSSHFNKDAILSQVIQKDSEMTALRPKNAPRVVDLSSIESPIILPLAERIKKNLMPPLKLNKSNNIEEEEIKCLSPLKTVSLKKRSLLSTPDNKKRCKTDNTELKNQVDTMTEKNCNLFDISSDFDWGGDVDLPDVQMSPISINNARPMNILKDNITDTPKTTNSRKSKISKLSKRSRMQLTQPEISQQNKKGMVTLSQPVHKKNKPPTPITPMPDFKGMITPELKVALKKVGVRALPRSKAVPLLTHIYDATHPYVTDSDGSPSPSSMAPPKLTDSPKKRGKKVPDEKSNSDLSSSQESTSSTNSGMSDLLEESTLVVNTGTNDSNYRTKLKNYFVSDPELHEKILTYTPIPLKELHANLKDKGIKLTLPTLMDYLDEQCITFTMPRSEKQKEKQNKRSQKFRKRMMSLMKKK